MVPPAILARGLSLIAHAAKAAQAAQAAPVAVEVAPVVEVAPAAPTQPFVVKAAPSTSAEIPFSLTSLNTRGLYTMARGSK